MAKDLYNLYMTLNDEDDLPEWCHYKLATSRKDLSDIADYLTSKVMKHCLDNEIGPDALRLEIKKSIVDDILAENRLDEFFFKKKQNKKNASSHSEYSKKYRNYGKLNNRKVGYINSVEQFSDTAYELAFLLKNYINTNAYHAIYRKLNQYDEIMSGFYSRSLEAIPNHCKLVSNIIKEEQTDKAKRKTRFEPVVTSARINPPKQKRGILSRIFGESRTQDFEVLHKSMSKLLPYIEDSEENIRKEVKNLFLTKSTVDLNLIRTTLLKVSRILETANLNIQKMGKESTRSYD